MEGCHKLKDFDDNLEIIIENLQFRENCGKRKPIEETHGDYVKSLVSDSKVVVKWICSEYNVADIFTKPLEAKTHRDFTHDYLI